MAYNEFAYFYDEFNDDADYDALFAAVTARLRENGVDSGILVDLGSGSASAKAWGCDLTYDYVKINGDYRT